MVSLIPDTAYDDLETPGSVPHRDATVRRHPFGSVEEIFAAVENKGTEGVRDTLKNLRHMLPTGLEDGMSEVILERNGPVTGCRPMMP